MRMKINELFDLFCWELGKKFAVCFRIKLKFLYESVKTRTGVTIAIQKQASKITDLICSCQTFTMDNFCV